MVRLSVLAGVCPLVDWSVISCFSVFGRFGNEDKKKVLNFSKTLYTKYIRKNFLNNRLTVRKMFLSLQSKTMEQNNKSKYHENKLQLLRGSKGRYQKLH